MTRVNSHMRGGSLREVGEKVEGGWQGCVVARVAETVEGDLAGEGGGEVEVAADLGLPLVDLFVPTPYSGRQSADRAQAGGSA